MKFGIGGQMAEKIATKNKRTKYKLFVISDIHSAYTLMVNALNDAGFDENNHAHKIVLCGDLFDRMDESLQLYDWAVDMINKNKLIYVKGNHETLIENCTRRGYPLWHDHRNGTFKTICDLAPDAKTFDEACNVVRKKLEPLLCNCINYLETENYIFVHSWLPDMDWRNASEKEWEDARWGNPYELAELGLPDKTVVFGHFHTSWPRHHYNGEPEFGEDADFSPYYGNGYIAIDGCVAYSKNVNVLVLEDYFLENA